MRVCSRGCGRAGPSSTRSWWRAVTAWLADNWPFERVAYAERAHGA